MLKIYDVLIFAIFVISET